MNQKGQALIEFILVLPILIFILLFIVDMGRLMVMKTHLESVLASVKIDTTTINDKEYDIKVSKEGDFVVLESCIDTYTQGLSKIIGEPACLKTSKEIKE